MTNTARVGNRNFSFTKSLPIPKDCSRHHNKLWKDNNTKSGKAKTESLNLFTSFLPHLIHSFTMRLLPHHIMEATSYSGSQVSSILPDPVVSLSSSLVSSEDTPQWSSTCWIQLFLFRHHFPWLVLLTTVQNVAALDNFSVTLWSLWIFLVLNSHYW